MKNKSTTFVLDLDTRCNHRCLFCMKSTSIAAGRDITYPSVLRQIRSAYRQGYRGIDFYGGEPTAYPFLAAAISYANQLGLSVYLATNCSYFARRKQAQGFLQQVKLSEIRTSLHSHSPEIADTITQVKGSFLSTVKGIKNILDAGSTRVWVTIVINALNYKDLEATVGFLHGMAVTCVVFSGLVMEGRLSDNPQLAVDPSQIQTYLLKALRLCDKLKIRWRIIKMPACILPSRLISHDSCIEEQDTLHFEKLAFCKRCTFAKRCSGLEKYHLKTFGIPLFCRSNEPSRRFYVRQFLPDKFCREFVDIKGDSLQLTSIMATVKSIKPCMDDWVAREKYAQFRLLCRRYGLHMQPDTVFRMATDKEIPATIIGKQWLTTTKAYGYQFNRRLSSGEVHVFISRSRTLLQKCFADGWYPVIIKNRVVYKPLVDSFKFGRSLGYPECCIEFFNRYNDWNTYSYLYEVFKNTPAGKPHYLCNPLIKNLTYSYIYHMPCSFRCQKTIELAARIRHAIQTEEPAFAATIDEYLKLPYLVFNENRIYGFKGRLLHGKISYSQVFFANRMKEHNIFEPDFLRGDSVTIDANSVVIAKGRRTIRKIKCKNGGFAPEIPFFIQCQDE